jgi:transcriptional regulator with XRE-family HTH domain
VAFSSSWKQKTLADELAALRAKTGMGAREVGDGVGWSHVKVTRIENASTRVTPRDVATLAAFYGVPQAEIDRLCEDARNARSDIWWTRYQQWLDSSYAAFLSYENDADRAWAVGPLVIPGLLQTQDYAVGLFEAAQIVQDPDRAEALIAVRMQRQQRLTEPEPLIFSAFIGEVALRAEYGNRAVLHEQLVHLRRLLDLPHITIRALLATSKIILWPIDLLEFEVGGPTVVFAETIWGSVVHDDPLEIRQAQRMIDKAEAAALSEAETIALIEQRIKETKD